jgi:hypothetical protein
MESAMGLIITVELSVEDAKRLDEAFKSGKLAELGITGVTTVGEKEQPEDPKKDVMVVETQRSDAPIKDDVPPHS